MSEKSLLQAEWKAHPFQERLRLGRRAFSGQAAPTERSARMLVFQSLKWLPWEAIVLGLAAATGRAILGTIVLKQLYATREPPDWTMVHIPWSEILVKAGTWLVVMIGFLLTSRRYRRTINMNQPLAVPPLELRWLPYGPLSRGAQRLVGANIILVVVIILLCFSQHGFSPLWAAYFSAEVVLLLGTIVFALRRETI